MGCGGRDGGGADACLVGKKASGDAVAQGVLDGCAVVRGTSLKLSRPRKNAFLEALSDYMGEVLK